MRPGAGIALAVTCILAFAGTLGAPLAVASGPAPPVPGAPVGWLDAHGGRMDGFLRLQADVRMMDADLGVEWPSDALRAGSALEFGGQALCLGGLDTTGCGRIDALRAGAGLLGGGDRGAVPFQVDVAAVQPRAGGECEAPWFAQKLSPAGPLDCASAIAYDDGDAVQAAAQSGFAQGDDLAAVAFSGSFADLAGLSLLDFQGLACTVQTYSGHVAMTIAADGVVSMVCDLGLDFDFDPDHCGAIDHKAAWDLEGPPAHGGVICEWGQGVGYCDPGYTAIFAWGHDVFCTDLSIDPANCGAVGWQVPSGYFCELGQEVRCIWPGSYAPYSSKCAVAGDTDCFYLKLVFGDLCVVQTGCVAGLFAAAAINPHECLDLERDRRHCGVVGNALPWGQMCIGGAPYDCEYPNDYDPGPCTLRVGACAPGTSSSHLSTPFFLSGEPCDQFSGCPGDGLDCIDLMTSPWHCGEHFRVVPGAWQATETGCVDGEFAILGCEDGWADLDGLFSNGCEAVAP